MKKSAIISLCFVFAVLGCFSEPSARPLTPGATVLAFGDSLTFGTGAEKGEDYPSQLAALTGLKVINAGVAGETTADGLKRINEALVRHGPELVILSLGWNDAMRSVPRNQIERNLTEIIVRAKHAGAQVLLLAQPGFTLMAKIPGYYAEIAKAEQILYDEDIVRDVAFDRDLKADRIHPNARGYRVLARKIAEFMKGEGLIR